jgi:D-aminoacyl-tRNA deacylase
MKLVIYSSEDAAGKNIAEQMISCLGFQKSSDEYMGNTIYQKQDTLLFQVDGCVKDLKSLPYTPKYCVVASRHKGESGSKTLTVHPTGNFGQAQMGGESARLQLTDSNAMRSALLLLAEKKKKYGLDYTVSREVTHHGPTELSFPLLYVEVGSTENEWRDLQACKAAAEAIDEMLFKPREAKPSIIGFGGPHYAPNFNTLAKNYALGHIMPKYSQSYISPEMVSEMVGKTYPRPELAAIDWKGLSGDAKRKLVSTIEGAGLKWEKTTKLK